VARVRISRFFSLSFIVGSRESLLFDLILLDRWWYGDFGIIKWPRLRLIEKNPGHVW
jgi:hypothetical protein